MAFSGITYSQRRGAARKRQIGFAGIQIEVPGLMGVRVVDQRGRAINQAEVIFTNPDTMSPFTCNTDSNGNCLVQKDTSNPNPVVVTKNRVSRTVNYTTGASFTVVLDMMKNFPHALNQGGGV
jgi:hypothetical protein